MDGSAGPVSLRILMVVPSGLGGTIQYSHNLANALSDRGHQVVFVTALGNEMKPFERRYELIEVFDRFKPHIGPIRAFLRRVRAFQPDIVHFQGAQRPEFYMILLLLLDRITTARFVWTPQDVLSNSQKPWHTRLLRAIYARMQFVFLNAKQNLDAVTRLFGVPQDRIMVLPIPDLVAFARTELTRTLPPELRLPEGQPLILCFGLIEERKGINTLIQAFATLAAQGGDATLLVMGKSLTDISKYENEIDRLGLHDRVQIIERYASFEEMNALFERAHHVVMAYNSGWNSGVLASAYGYGKPVIASTVGGFEEVVTDGTSGLLVPPRDTDALARAMGRMLDDDPAYDRMCAGATEASADASWPHVAERTEQAYRDVVMVTG